MIQRKTFLKTSDKTNVKWYQTIHLYKGFKRKKSETSFFIKGSAKKVKPPKVEYKGFKRKYLKKGSILRSLIIKTIYKSHIKLRYASFFKKNSSIVIKKKNVTRSKYFFGLVSKNLKRKKFLTLFNKKF